MLAHLANPWILARMVLGVCAAALATVAAIGSLRVLSGYRSNAPPDERTLALERQSELVATALSVAFTLELLAAVLTVLASDRLAGSIRGAMCAFGVFGSNRWGSVALRASIFASAGCTAWLATRRVDVRLRRGSLVRMLAALALVVTVLVYADLATSAAYFFGLDMNVVASCCSVFVDTSRVGAEVALDAHARTRELVIAAALVLAALTSGVALARRASGTTGFATGVLGVAAGVLALRAVTNVVAPYVYESPAHQCPYCLLHAQAAPPGPVLLASLGVAFMLGVASLAVVALLRRPGARTAATDVLARIGRASAVAWSVVLVSALWPIAQYRLASGTFDLFR
jgi:hypothetical protein